MVLPQALRLVLPRLISLLMESTLGYAVSCPEPMKQGDFLTARTQLLFQTFVIIAMIYMVVNLLLGQLAGAVERHLGRLSSGTAALDIAMA